MPLESLIDSFQNLQQIQWQNVLHTVLGCGTNPNTLLCTLSSAFGHLLTPNTLESYTGAASSEIAAALATQGYYQQEELLEMIVDPNGALFGLAPLLYLLSGVGGLIMLALGAPPKLYLWFLLGPGLYAVFLNWKAESAGNMYRIGARIMPQNGVQELVQSVAPESTGSVSVGGLPWITWDNPAEVSAIFAMIDSVISNGVQAIIAGVTPIKEVGSANLNYESFWWVMGDIRWRLLEAITSARLNQADLRDLLITFWSSECGGALRKYLSMPRYMAARNAKNSMPPPSVFDGQPGDIAVRLSSVSTPTPLSMRSLFGDIFRRNEASAAVNFQNFSFQLSALGQPDFAELAQQTGQIKCHDFLKIVVAGIRAEAGYNFAKLMAQAPITIPRFTVRGNDNFILDLGWTLLKPEGVGPMTPKELGRELFAYWNLSSLITTTHSLSVGGGTNLGPITINFTPGSNDPFSPLYDVISGNLTERDDVWVQRFVDIITAYIFKNELAFAPPLLHDSVGDANSYTQAATASVASVGATSKFGEIYIWAQMLPKVQGLFLYWLAVGFPLAVILMVVPNFHKALITWTLFWTWVKSWDIGFTLIKRVEPVLWSLVGKSDLLDAVMGRVLRFGEWSTVGVFCVNNAGVGSTFPPCGGSLVPLTIVRGAQPNLPMSVEEVIRTFDLGLSVHNSLWLEEGNAFYLYLIAAMYFAVPVIMGQLILGSKAAMANLVKDFTGQISSDGSRAAGQAYSAQRQAQASATAASFNQAEMLKNMREQGLAERAIRAQNLSIAKGIDSAIHGQISNGINTQAAVLQNAIRASQSLASAEIGRFTLPVTIGNLMQGTNIGGRIPFIDLIMAGLSQGSVRAQVTQGNEFDAARRIDQFLAGGNAAGVASQHVGNLLGNIFPGRRQSENPQGEGSDQGYPAGSGLSHGNRTPNVTQFGNLTSGLPPYLNPNSQSGPGIGRDGQLGLGGGTDGQSASPQIPGLQQAQEIDTAKAYIYSLLRGVIESIPQQGNHLLGYAQAAQDSRARALMQEQNLASFLAQQEGSLYSQESQRLNYATNFGAQSSTWLARSNYANAVAATLSAYGVSPQTVSPGEKPTDFMGASWLGQLGGSAEAEAKLVDNTTYDGFLGVLRSQTARLQNFYGSDAITSYFNNTVLTPGTVIGLGALSISDPVAAKNRSTDVLVDNLQIPAAMQK